MHLDPWPADSLRWTNVLQSSDIAIQTQLAPGREKGYYVKRDSREGGWRVRLQPLTTPPPLPIRQSPTTQPLEFRSLQSTEMLSPPASRFAPGMKKAIGASVVTLIFLLISMMTAWWGYYASYSGSGGFIPSTTTQSANYYMGQVCVSLKGSVPSFENLCFPYATASIYLPSAKSLENVFSLTNLFVMVGLVLSVLTIVFLSVSAFRPNVGLIAVLCASIGTVLILVAPIYLYAALPGAIKSTQSGLGVPALPIDGFYGSSSFQVSGYRGAVVWGAGLGWFAALFAFLFSLAATVTAVSVVREAIPHREMISGPLPTYSYHQPQQGDYEHTWASLGGSSGRYSTQDAQFAHQLTQTPEPPVVSSCLSKESGPPSRPAEAPPRPAPSRICPSCGAVFEADQLSCKLCGAQVTRDP